MYFLNIEVTDQKVIYFLNDFNSNSYYSIRINDWKFELFKNILLFDLRPLFFQIQCLWNYVDFYEQQWYLFSIVFAIKINFGRVWLNICSSILRFMPVFNFYVYPRSGLWTILWLWLMMKQSWMVHNPLRA